MDKPVDKIYTPMSSCIYMSISMQVVYMLMMQIKKKVYIPINNNNNNFICIAVYTKALYRFTIKKRK